MYEQHVLPHLIKGYPWLLRPWFGVGVYGWDSTGLYEDCRDILKLMLSHPYHNQHPKLWTTRQRFSQHRHACGSGSFLRGPGRGTVILRTPEYCCGSHTPLFWPKCLAYGGQGRGVAGVPSILLYPSTDLIHPSADLSLSLSLFFSLSLSLSHSLHTYIHIHIYIADIYIYIYACMYIYIYIYMCRSITMYLLIGMRTSTQESIFPRNQVLRSPRSFKSPV